MIKKYNNNSKIDTNALIKDIINQNPITTCLNLIFDDCVIRVCSNSNELIDKLTHYFSGFTGGNGTANIDITAIEGEFPSINPQFILKEPDPGKTKIKEEYINFPEHRIIRKHLTGMHFIFGGQDNIAIGPCIENDNQVINFINNRYIQWNLHQNSLLGHAAGVEWKGNGIALAGFSGMGKSSLALHLMNHGVTFISNDRLMIKSNGNRLEMYGVPKLPRVNPGTILNNPNLIPVMNDNERLKFSKLPLNELWELEHKYDVYIDRCFGKNKFQLRAPMKALFILNWKRKNIPTIVHQVDIQERKDLLKAFIKSPGLFYEESEQDLDISEESYINHLKLCSVFEITGGVNFELVANKCYEYLNTGNIK